jgi:hypothetical protein
LVDVATEGAAGLAPAAPGLYDKKIGVSPRARPQRPCTPKRNAASTLIIPTLEASGYVVVRQRQAMRRPGNASLIFYMDIFLPFFGFALAVVCAIRDRQDSRRRRVEVCGVLSSTRLLNAIPNPIP